MSTVLNWFHLLCEFLYHFFCASLSFAFDFFAASSLEWYDRLTDYFSFHLNCDRFFLPEAIRLRFTPSCSFLSSVSLRNLFGSHMWKQSVYGAFFIEYFAENGKCLFIFGCYKIRIKTKMVFVRVTSERSESPNWLLLLLWGYITSVAMCSARSLSVWARSVFFITPVRKTIKIAYTRTFSHI